VCSTLSVEYLISGFETVKLEKSTVLIEVETALAKRLSVLRAKLSTGKSKFGLCVSASYVYIIELTQNLC